MGQGDPANIALALAIIHHVFARGLEDRAFCERWVLGWGAEAEVLAPTELRQQISRTLTALTARYTT